MEEENIHSRVHREIPTKEFAPNPWKAMCESRAGGWCAWSTPLAYRISVPPDQPFWSVARLASPQSLHLRCWLTAL